MKHIIDPELIILASPDYAYGRRLVLTDEETERSTLETMDAMRKAYDKTLPVKILRMRGNPLILDCPTCETSLYNYENDNHCYNCGQAIDWEVSP